jgi:hypothetical protein
MSAAFFYQWIGFNPRRPALLVSGLAFMLTEVKILDYAATCASKFEMAAWFPHILMLGSASISFSASTQFCSQ